MARRKIRVGVIFGGQSEEHEISIRSAESVIRHLNRDIYEVRPIKIEKDGAWIFDDFYVPCENFPFSFSVFRKQFDVIFPMLHGPYGEDGTIQGLMELAHIPYVGPDHLSSAMCMDKGVMKAMLSKAGLPTPRSLSLQSFDIEKILTTFAFPIFVKPARLGSSIGMSKVHSEKELLPALQESFKYDERIIVEEGIEGREFEVSVLGNLDPKASLPGEIVPMHDFYSYEAKYVDENGAYFVLPAKMSSEQTKEIQELALEAYKTMRCEGMARVDFFMEKGGRLLINELNTIPGFTSISLYPKLWEVSGLSYSDLLCELINLAIDRFNRLKNRSVKMLSSSQL